MTWPASRDLRASAAPADTSLYLVNDQLKLNYFKKGERLLENQTIPLELDEKQGKIQYTDLASLRLLPWYGPYFVLSGLQKIRDGVTTIEEVVKYT